MHLQSVSSGDGDGVGVRNVTEGTSFNIVLHKCGRSWPPIVLLYKLLSLELSVREHYVGTTIHLSTPS